MVYLLCSSQAQPLLLSNISEGRVCVDPRLKRDPRHFQRSKHISRNQRLRLETPSWRILDYEGNPMAKEEVAQQRDCILRAPLVVQGPKNAEDIFTDSPVAQDAMLPVLAKIAPLIDMLRLGGSYELVHFLWSQFFLTATRVTIDITWSRDEVLAGNFFVPFFYISMCIGLLVLCFSRSFWMGCIPAPLLSFLGRSKPMDTAALNMRREGQKCGRW